MGMLRLSPEIQQYILSMPDTGHRSPVTERTLRPLTIIADSREPLREFPMSLRRPGGAEVIGHAKDRGGGAIP
jgi:hypothetical protein